MPQISIGSTEPGELLLERLSHEAMDIAQTGIILSFQLRNVDGVNLIDYQLDGRAQIEEWSPWRGRMAEILAEMVIDLFEVRLAQETLRRHHDYLAADDITRIAQRVKEQLQKDNVRLGSKRSERKSMVAARFLETLDEFQERLDLDGFVRFRLKDYQQELQKVVSDIVDGYLMEKEHREFIQLLRYFVDLQKPKIDWVQVMMSHDGFFCILDRGNTPIHAEYLDAGSSPHHQDINYDDLLISALITIAPAHLVIHARSFANQETVSTICSVFEGRCTVCEGCPICQ
ncbi:MAG: sporulation protein YtxC [Bacillota bacterium]